MRPLITLALGASLLAGCLPSRTVGHFGEGAFYHMHDDYRIRYADPDGRTLLGPSWELLNYDVGEDGHPSFARTGGDYDDLVQLGLFVPTRRPHTLHIPRVDVRYRDAERRSEIWVRTVPLTQGWGTANIQQVLHASITAMNRPMVGAPDLLGRPWQGARTEVRDFGRAQVDGYVASFAELDLVGQTTERITLVAMHPGAHHIRVSRWRTPALIVFGLSTPPETHAALRPEFESLVSRVDIRPETPAP